jgi:hypothetical protein
LLVIVDVFVTQRQPIDSLREHLLNRVLDQILIPPVQKTLCQPRQQLQTFVGLTPPSELIAPPSKRATIPRLSQASNPKLDWLHSVIAKAVLSLA